MLCERVLLIVNTCGHIPVAYKRIDSMIACAETSQLHLLSIFNLLCITITPFDRHIRVRVSIHKHVECTVAIELWKKCD